MHFVVVHSVCNWTATLSGGAPNTFYSGVLLVIVSYCRLHNGLCWMLLPVARALGAWITPGMRELGYW